VEGRITVVGELPEEMEAHEEAPAEEMPEMEPPVAEEHEMAPMPAATHGVHVVQPGEVLWRIAQQHQTTWEMMAEMNALTNPHLIFPGQELVYPAH